MPIYNFKKGNKIWSEMMTISEMEFYLEHNPDIQLGVSSPAIVSGTGQIQSKVPDGFKDVLKGIKKKAGRKSTISV